MLTGGREDCHMRRMETLFQRRIMRSRPQPPCIIPPREGRSSSWINNIVGPRYNILLEEKGDQKSSKQNRIWPTFEVLRERFEDVGNRSNFRGRTSRNATQ
jgi:hypothetical protein